MKIVLFLPACLIVLAASACQASDIPFLQGSTPMATQVPSQAPPMTETPTEAPAGQVTSVAPPASPTALAAKLRLWVPPLFDPNGATPAGQLLKARLDDYSRAHAGTIIEVRVKGRDDPAGLLEALSLTRSAAPSALPDVVALPRVDLEAAALKGTLHSPDALTDLLASPDWYPYARQAGHVQNTPYGLPFAGDALAIAYHPSQFERLPTRWEELFVANKSLALYRDDPNGLLVLSLYLSTGSPLQDNSNKPYLDQDALTRVLQMIQKARLIPLQSEEAAWTAFVDNRAQLALVWTSRYLQGPPRDTALMPLPSPDETPFTLATTWVWALAGSDPQNDPAALELATWLSEPEFMAAWDQAAGYLSPRPTALKVWDQKASLDLLSQSAKLVPGNDLLAALGPLLQDGLTRTINGEPPADVAASIIEALK
jgi:ABC-type glycerol-3-phosphate transport system substrate-binding protein